MRRILGILLATVFATNACSDRGLSRSRAEQLITSHDTFKAQAFFSFTTEMGFTKGTIASACLGQADVERDPATAMLLKSGWVSIDTRPTAIWIGRQANCPALVLTPKGQEASARWQSRPTGIGQGWSWSIPIGERKLVEITGLTQGPDGATYAELTWKWNPNSMGEQLQASALPKAKEFFELTRRGRASCRLWDDGWRCKMDHIGTRFEDAGQFPVS